MFDYLTCKLSCVGEHQQGWQTKDLECFLNQYEISESGVLWLISETSMERVPYDGSLEFYVYHPSLEELVMWDATFKKGSLVRIDKAESRG